MPLHKATIEILLYVEDDATACDAIAETMRSHLKEFADEPANTIFIDWRYANNGYPSPHDGEGFEYASTLSAPIVDGAWTTKDDAAATTEGWDIFDSDTRGLEIQRIDSPDDRDQPAFVSDEEAFAHCECRAAEGSALHAKALAIHRASRAELEASSTDKNQDWSAAST